jgi:hypothetical protein
LQPDTDRSTTASLIVRVPAGIFIRRVEALRREVCVLPLLGIRDQNANARAEVLHLTCR